MMKKMIKVLLMFILTMLVCYVPENIVWADEIQESEYDNNEDAEYYKYYSKSGYREELNQDADEDSEISLYASRVDGGTLGCDVSRWNGTINWIQAKNAGIKYTFVKVAGRGRTNGIISDDPKYKENIRGALNAGIRVGVYFYSEAINVNEAIEEANYLIERARNYNITLPLVIDYEGFNSEERIGQANLSKSQYTEIVKAFCETVKNAGYTPMIYASASFYTNYMNGEELSRYYRIWSAAYSHQPDHYNRVTYDFWQFTSTAQGASYGMGSTYVDLDYWYDDGTNFKSVLSGLCYDGSTDNEFQCHYYKNGVIDKTYSGVTFYEDKWYKVKNGGIDTSFTGLANNNKGWWYIQNGRVNFSYEGICGNAYGNWYVKNGKIQFSKNGLVYVNNTSINADNGKKYSFNGWYYIKDGQICYNEEKVIKNSNGWWYVGRDGKVHFDKNTVAKNSNGWWAIRNGKVDFGFNGVAENDYGIWYCTAGRVRFSVNEVVKLNQSNYRGWYYIHNGELQRGIETVQKNNNGWWYIGTDGKVDFNKNTVAKNENGWWVIRNGKVNFNYNGIATNQYGSWYCTSGKVQQKTTNVVYTSGSWFYIKKGEVVKGVETVQKNSNGWWYIGKDGKVNFNYNGLAENENGLWYVEGGRVTFRYNSLKYRDIVTGNKYKIVNSKAILINK